MSEWRYTKDELPNIAEEVIVCVREDYGHRTVTVGMLLDHYSNEQTKKCFDIGMHTPEWGRHECVGIEKVERWMPLPELPKEDL